MRRLTYALLVVVTLFSACSKTEEKSKKGTKVQPRAAPQTTRGDTNGDVDALVAKFQKQLKGELLAAMEEGGAANAIQVCSTRADAIAADVSTDQLRIRRIGTRTRNPENGGDSHDRTALEQLSKSQPSVKTAEPERHYRAIFVGPLCLNCHGKPEQLSPSVRDKLSELYPHDAATGYEAGDLRGAFVVESRD